jgi:aminocarboxymuconate-semialdehyde decarboxylase
MNKEQPMPQSGPIDVQTHYLPPAVVEALERRPEWPNIVRDGDQRLMAYGTDTAYPLVPEMFDLDMKLATMDRANIGMSVLSVNIPGLDWFTDADVDAVARETNDQLAQAMADHPDRFGALACLPMQRPEAAAAELERAMGLGLSGAMVYSNVAGRPLDEEAFRPVFETADRLGGAILIHPTFPLSAPTVDKYALVSVLGYMFDTSTAAMRLILSGIYNRCPDLKLILPHTGGVVPWLMGRIEHEGFRCHGDGYTELEGPPEEYIRKLYVDTVCGSPLALQYVIDFFGVEHVLWGSDHPFWDPEWTNEAMAKLDLSDADREAIESGNAMRVLNLGVTT